MLSEQASERRTTLRFPFTTMVEAAEAEPASTAAAAQPPQAAGSPAGAAATPISPPQTDAAEAAVPGGTSAEGKAGHKRKVALFMAYVGAGYMVRTLGAELFPHTLCHAKYISEAHYTYGLV